MGRYYLGSYTNSIQPKSVEASIRRFHDEKPIRELKFFPVEYFQDHERRKQDLVKRGRLYVSLQQKKCMYFDEENIDTPRQRVRTPSATSSTTLLFFVTLNLV